MTLLYQRVVQRSIHSTQMLDHESAAFYEERVKSPSQAIVVLKKTTLK